jgi:hypothetical protein
MKASCKAVGMHETCFPEVLPGWAFLCCIEDMGSFLFVLGAFGCFLTNYRITVLRSTAARAMGLKGEQYLAHMNGPDLDEAWSLTRKDSKD